MLVNISGQKPFKRRGEGSKLTTPLDFLALDF